MEAKGLPGRRLLIADCYEPWFFKKLNIHQAKCATWWTSEHSSAGEQLAYIQYGGGSSPSVPLSKAREQLCWIPQSFHFFFPFVKVIGRTARWPPWEWSSSAITTERFSKREETWATVKWAAGSNPGVLIRILYILHFHNFSLCFCRPVNKIMGLYFYKGCNDWPEQLSFIQDIPPAQQDRRRIKCWDHVDTAEKSTIQNLTAENVRYRSGTVQLTSSATPVPGKRKALRSENGIIFFARHASEICLGQFGNWTMTTCLCIMQCQSVKTGMPDWIITIW